jgi:hypothetical protein
MIRKILLRNRGLAEWLTGATLLSNGACELFTSALTIAAITLEIIANAEQI